MSADRQNACTPRFLFDALHKEYRFDIDAAADKHNALCKNFWSIENNALAQDWSKKRVFCNPPYRLKGYPIKEWIFKGIHAKIAVFLVPATTSAEWFHFALRHGEIHFFDGRLQFSPPEGVTYTHGNDRDSVLVVLGHEALRRAVYSRSALTGLR